MISSKSIPGNLLIAGVALILQDVTPSQLDAIKRGIEQVTGNKAQVEVVEENQIPECFGKCIEFRSTSEGRVSAPSTNY